MTKIEDNKRLIIDDNYSEYHKIERINVIYSEFDKPITELSYCSEYINGYTINNVKKLYKSSGYIFLNEIIHTDIILRHVDFNKYKLIKVPIAFYTNSIWSSNYCHFLMEEIPKMLQYQEIDENIPIICNYNNTYIDEYIKMFKIKNPIIPRTENVIIKCDNIIHYDSSTERILSKYHFDKCYNYLKTFIDYTPMKSNIGIVIKRNEWERQILNHDELMISLNKNFSNIKWIVFNGDLSIKDSISLFNNVDYVIGPQGSGFTNTVYSRNGTKVFKIISTPFNLTGVTFFNIAYPNNEKELYVIACKLSNEANGQHFRLNLDNIIPVLKKYID
jgi:capsular polysaccharide biosynthesis protein